MKTDTWTGSVVWGRIGGAVLLIVAFIAQGLGIDFGAQDQQQAFGVIQTLLASIGGLMIMISKYREKIKEKSAAGEQKSPRSDGQSGKATLVLLIAADIALLTTVVMLAGGAIVAGFSGCAPQQSAVMQITAQTDDTGKLAAAMYYDAQGLYKNAASMYLQYRSYLKARRPEIDTRVKATLNEMKATLDKWRLLRDMTRIDAITAGSERYQAMRRQIIFDLADYIDNGKAVD